MSELSVAVLTGGHRHHVLQFIDFFTSLDGVNAYVFNIKDWLTPSGLDDRRYFAGTQDVHHAVRDGFDVTVFYTMTQQGPDEEERACVERLIENGQSIFVLHHAVLHWRYDDRWGQIMGLGGARWVQDIDCGGPVNGVWFGTVPVKVNADHPLSAGLADFEIEDETYAVRDCEDDCDVLLTTDRPNSMRTIAWTRMEGDSRIFCLQLGHDPQTWSHPAFRTVVQNGLQWCGGRHLESA